MTRIPSRMPESVSDASRKLLGRIVRERRAFIGLSQEELAEYGGPRKTTVSKIERGVDESFSARTQQQLERALGWELGTWRDILATAESEWADGRLLEAMVTDYVECALPDLAALRSVGAVSASELSDEELISELSARLAASRAPKGGGSGERGESSAEKTLTFLGDAETLSIERAHQDVAKRD